MLEQGDIQIIAPPTADHPGQARLVRAIIGDARPDAPSSRPLLSHQSRSNIGYVANVKFMEEPYDHSYVIR